MSGLAALLAALTLSGEVRAWHVYVIAFALGLVSPSPAHAPAMGTSWSVGI
jgi:hypothetical protein